MKGRADGSIGDVATCAPNAPLATRRACISASHALGSSSVARGRAEVAAVELNDEDAGAADDARVAKTPRASTVLGVRSSMLGKRCSYGHTRTVVGQRGCSADSDTAGVYRCMCGETWFCGRLGVFSNNQNCSTIKAGCSFALLRLWPGVLDSDHGPGLCAMGFALVLLRVSVYNASSEQKQMLLRVSCELRLPTSDKARTILSIAVFLI